MRGAESGATLSGDSVCKPVDGSHEHPAPNSLVVVALRLLVSGNVGTAKEATAPPLAPTDQRRSSRRESSDLHHQCSLPSLGNPGQRHGLRAAGFFLVHFQSLPLPRSELVVPGRTISTSDCPAVAQVPRTPADRPPPAGTGPPR